MTDVGSGPALDQALRRAIIVAADDVFDVQGLIDSAELALVLGRRDDARLLYCCAFLLTGFADKARAGQRRIASRIDLPLDPEAGARGQRSDDLTGRAIALTDLADMLALDPTPLPDAAEVAIAMPVETSDRAAVPEIAVDALLPRLVCALHSSGAETERALDVVLAELRDAAASAPIVDLRDHIDADLARLAQLLAMRFLQTFLRVNFALAYAPWGSGALLRAAARLDPAGLGNCFENVPRLVRGRADIIGMVRTASGAGDDAAIRAQVDRWSVLLSVRMREHDRADLADAFADADDLRPLWSLLAISAFRLPFWFERDLIVRIRDAGLDCNDLALAVAAQGLIVHRTSAAHEWIILGDIYATAGDVEAAEATYARCLGDQAPAPALRERMDALRGDDVASLALVGGMHTPFARQRRRLARWGAVPARLRGALVVAET